MTKKQRTILTSTLVTIAVAVPAITAITIMAIPRLPSASHTYLLSFNDDPQKQKYLNFLRSQVDEVFKQYKKENKNFKGLNLEFINLASSPTQGINNFFLELDKALKAINENLSFTMLTRNPITLERGFRQGNVDMVSFYWTPDYNDVGTWLTYMLSTFNTANLWPLISTAINNPDQFADYNKTGWIKSLAVQLANLEFTYNSISSKGPKKAEITYEDPNTHEIKVLSMLDIMRLVKDGASENTIFTIVGNVISAWSNSPESQKIGITNPEAISYETNPELYNHDTHLYKDFEGGIKGYKDSKLNEFMNFLNSSNSNIPYVQDGPQSQTVYLVKDGLHIPQNVNSYVNQRDWYITNTLDTTLKKPTIPSYVKPFDTTNSPLNPTFSKTSTGSYFCSLFTPLFSWSSLGDFYTDPTTGAVDDRSFRMQLLSYGAAKMLGNGTSNGLLKDLQEVIDTPVVNQDGTPILNPDGTEKEKIFEVPIRAIPWVDYQGNVVKDDKGQTQYLSPQDYWAGFKGYDTAIETRYTTNEYFSSLISLNMEKTLNDPLNQERNTNPNEQKVFRIHFNDNIDLLAKNIIDILTSQYFTALPAFNEKVKNITDDERFKKITGVDLSQPWEDENGKPIRKPFAQTPEMMSKLYGCGDGKKNYKEILYTSPYLLSNVTDQTYEFKINNIAFDTFKILADAADNINKPTVDNYFSFKKTTTIHGQEVSKIDNIEFKYVDKSNQQIQLELFNTNQIDTSPIPLAQKTEIMSSESYKKSLYQKATLKVNASDLIPYNINIYARDDAGNIVLNGKMENGKTPTYADLKVDKYGNIVYPKGVTPKLKDKITPGYYDLIVKNYFTPINGTDENGKLLPPIDRSSAIIRTAINDMINWFSLTSLVYVGQSKVMQNSFTPYGVVNMRYNSNGNLITNESENRAKYWNLAAYKVGQGSHKGFANLPEAGSFGNTMGGNIEWTWNELILDWGNKFHNKGGGS